MGGRGVVTRTSRTSAPVIAEDTPPGAGGRPASGRSSSFWPAWRSAWRSTAPTGIVWDRVAEGLHIFTSGFPGAPEQGQSVALTVAEVLGPVVALWATLRIVWELFVGRFTVMRARRRRAHVVVCGLGMKGSRAAQAFRAAGMDVVGIDLEPTGDEAQAVRAAGALVLEADAAKPAGLLDAARTIVCACGSDGLNERIAEAALSRRPPGAPGLDAWVHVNEPELARILRASNRDPRLHYFCVYDVWARRVVAELPRLVPGAQPDPHLVVVGSSSLAKAFVVLVAREWNADSTDASLDARLCVTIVGPDATETCDALQRRYPALGRLTRLRPVPSGVNGHAPELVAQFSHERRRPVAVVIATDGDAAVLASARVAADRLEGTDGRDACRHRSR